MKSCYQLIITITKFKKKYRRLTALPLGFDGFDGMAGSTTPWKIRDELSQVKCIEDLDDIEFNFIEMLKHKYTIATRFILLVVHAILLR